jgi:hypothetical protein
LENTKRTAGKYSFLQGTINSIQQTGNTLSLITSDNVYYLLYRKNKESEESRDYIFLGKLPQIPVIDLRTSNNMIFERVHYDEVYTSNSVRPEDFIDATKGLVNVAIDKLNEAHGLHLFDACFIRYAFRLYDGTLIKHSPPILIMPARSILGNTSISPGEKHMDSLKWVDYTILHDGNLWYISDGSLVSVHGYRIYMRYDLSFEDWEDWKDIIKSVDIFMSQPLGLSNIENIRMDFPYNLD